MKIVSIKRTYIFLVTLLGTQTALAQIKSVDVEPFDKIIISPHI